MNVANPFDPSTQTPPRSGVFAQDSAPRAKVEGAAGIPAGLHFSKQPLHEFLNRLASSSVTPGGGSAASVTAALGVALLEMTAGINQKRKFSKKSAAHLKKLRKIRRGLLTLATKDAQAFLRLSRIGKKKRSGPFYQRALETCAAIPLEVCSLCHESLRMAVGEVSRTSRWLASDLAEAALLLEAAFRAARWNVEVNLKSLLDKKHATKVGLRLESLERSSLKQANKIRKARQWRRPA